MENQERSGFVQSRLPWLITAAALIVYVLTLNRWVSLSSLPVISNVSSRELVPPIGQPLRFLVLLPFRWLPVAGQPIALNVFTALCAALTLGLLGRSVALLPHDRTREQRQRERSESSLLSIPAAWVPPVFAVMACGLQLTFWEHATAATGEMVDLLLFAYAVRCLLEYRFDQCECWLTRSALVYGIAITNNYAMVGFFPVYLAALIWMKGLSFFEFRFVAKMFGWGTAGLTLYLLPALINAFSDQAGAGFWQSLRYELTSQKGAMLGFPRYIILIAGLTSLLPLLLIGIRWPSTFGETSPTGGMITTLLFRVVHAILLAAGIWVAFDAPFGPRMLLEQLLQQVDDPLSTVPFLTFYYLGALCLGYFAGYFLLVFGQETAKSWMKVSAASRLCNRAVTGAIWLAAIATPVGLVYKNLGAIRATGGSLLRDFARLATTGLPKPDFIALSDDPYVLALVQGNLPHVEDKPDPILTDTRLLRYTPYQESLHRRFPGRWPALPATVSTLAQVDPVFLIYEVSGMAKSNETYYLNPSFGYYFEPLYLEPHGMVYRLVPYATNAIAPPRLSEQVMTENQRFWNEAGPVLDRVIPLIGHGIADARAVGRWYSRALNWWGVDLQKLGRLDDAAQAFARARKLNPQNVAVEINSDFNQTLRTGASAPAKAKGNLEERVGRYRDWNSLLAANGPIDDPEICFRLAQTFASQSLFRQSALQLMRVLQLDPDNLDARFLLAGVFLAGGIPDKTLETVAEIRSRQTSRPLSSTNLVELVRLESTAHFNKGDVATAEKILLDARRQHPRNPTLSDTLFQMYVQANRLTNALSTLEESLKLDPDNTGALLNKAYVCMQLKDYDEASNAVSAVLKKEPDNPQALLDRGAICIQTKAYKDAVAPLNQLLKLQPDNRIALMNRAIANLQSDQLDAAQRDYETLQKLVPTLYRVYYGLGEIASRRKDVAAAVRNYELYLKYVPPDAHKEAEEVSERLRQLKAGSGH